MHIGLIGGIGPASTEFYYRELVKAHAEAGRKMALTIAHADAGTLVKNLQAGQSKAQAQIFARYIDQLRAGGAEAVAVTSMGGHFCIEDLKEISSLPIIDAIPEINAHLSEMGVKRIALLGTEAVMESKLYGGLTAVDTVALPKAELKTIHNHYIAMAMAVNANDAQKDYFHEIGLKLSQDHGAELILLAGTDLFLAFGDEDHGYPIIDSAIIHVNSITKASLNNRATPHS
ncbi:MAG: aspartate/glutamate racemase family protein [Hellea sp.]